MRLTFLVLFASLLLTGCADPSTIATQDEAKLLVEAAMNEFSDAAEQATGETAFTVSCSGGGTITVSTELESSYPVKGTMTLDYQGCGTEGLVLDGQLDIDIDSDDEGTNMSLNGDLDSTGAVAGLCRFALDMRMEATRTGVAGSLCGFAASDFSTQVIPD